MVLVSPLKDILMMAVLFEIAYFQLTTFKLTKLAKPLNGRVTRISQYEGRVVYSMAHHFKI